MTLAPQDERRIYQDELDYRRRRRHDIFAWSSSLLIAITGAVIAAGLHVSTSLAVQDRIVATIAVAALASYSGLWWHGQRRLGQALRRRIEEIDHRLGIELPQDERGALQRVGGLLTLMLLAVVAVFAIWLPGG